MASTPESPPDTTAELPFPAEELSLLRRWFGWRDAPHALRRHFNQVAYEQLRRREAEVAALRGADDWRRRQQAVRRRLQAIFGPFPERTALNPRVTGTLRRDGYRVEKVHFESRPGFHVTGCLFVPQPLAAPAPAILNPIGHTDIAFRAELYQLLILNLVRKGFVVLAYDPPGQGERLQYLDPQTGTSRVGRSTQEHSYFGRQLSLSGPGQSAASYFAWDGMRAVDYLLTRPEVDGRRIGATGISGGGTQTAYVAALDERVVAAAPACYIAGFRRLLDSLGAQDAEQNPPGFLAAGLDHADLLEVRAPQPCLVVATTRDYFSIQGARETCAEVATAYAALGAPDAFGRAEDDYGHGYTARTREALYAFFQRVLDLPGDPRDEPVEMLSAADLTVTATGQVATALGGETVFSLHHAHAASLLEDLSARRRDLERHLPQVRAAAARLSGYQSPTPPAAEPGSDGPAPPVDVTFTGRLRHPDYAVERLMLAGGVPTLTPALALVPPGAGPHRAALFLHPQGKSAALAPGSAALALVQQGWMVLAPDLSGRGELAPAAQQGTSFEPVLTGGSVPGVHAAEIARAARYLRSRPDALPEPGVAAVGVGALGPALLHAAALGDSLGPLVLLEAPSTWARMALHRDFNTEFSSVVPGALAAYDLPDLAACLAPVPLAVLNPTDHLSRPLPAETLNAEWQVTRAAYDRAAAGAHLVLQTAVHQPAAAVVAALAG